MTLHYFQSIIESAKEVSRIIIQIISFVLLIIFLKSNLIINEIQFSVLNNNFNLKNINLYQEVLIQDESEWYLSIPKIQTIKSPIHENIESDILENYIGHFPSSSYLSGNICLAAHNAGYKNNYFKDLCMLEIGDEIMYNYNNQLSRYIVDKIEIISDTDFSFMALDSQDRITLITCITGLPSSRLCIQGIKEEDNE